MPPIFDFRNHTVTAVAGGTVIQVLPGDQNRVMLLLSSADSAPAFVFQFSVDANIDHSFLSIVSPFTFAMPYRDFGSLVTMPLFAGANAGANTLRILEIVRV